MEITDGLILMSAFSNVHLKAILAFLYTGQSEVAWIDLDDFMRTSENLQIMPFKENVQNEQKVMTDNVEIAYQQENYSGNDHNS